MSSPIRAEARRCLRLIAIAALTVPPGRLSGQVVRGVVLDSATGHPLAAATVVVSGQRDSAPTCSVVTGADGAFRCGAVVSSGFDIVIRHIAYVPLRVSESPIAVGDSLIVRVRLVRSTVALDTVRAIDTTYKHGLFWVTPGRVQFEQHMDLGRGHFIAGEDIRRSGVAVSQYLLQRFGDSLTAVANSLFPVVPIQQNKFLTSTGSRQCLYVRIDRLGLA
ncbi:MAG TPA: carboxypeptidase-like regulatory domain-containing protein, partial [Gemmatimonadaceae bacterium]|nr:carboxypeptidase-like regulatory domain-containing protein [Gemmatimonadaceae bacterium]